jgi:hypothetical protein
VSRRRAAIERTYRSASAKRIDLQGKPGWRKVVEFYSGDDVYPTDVSLLTGSDLPYSVRILQRLVKEGWAQQTRGPRTAYHIFKRQRKA